MLNLNSLIKKVANATVSHKRIVRMREHSTVAYLNGRLTIGGTGNEDILINAKTLRGKSYVIEVNEHNQLSISNTLDGTAEEYPLAFLKQYGLTIKDDRMIRSWAYIAFAGLTASAIVQTFVFGLNVGTEQTGIADTVPVVTLSLNETKEKIIGSVPSYRRFASGFRLELKAPVGRTDLAYQLSFKATDLDIDGEIQCESNAGVVYRYDFQKVCEATPCLQAAQVPTSQFSKSGELILECRHFPKDSDFQMESLSLKELRIATASDKSYVNEVLNQIKRDFEDRHLGTEILGRALHRSFALATHLTAFVDVGAESASLRSLTESLLIEFQKKEDALVFEFNRAESLNDQNSASRVLEQLRSLYESRKDESRLSKIYELQSQLMKEHI